MLSISRIGRRYGWIPSLPSIRTMNFADHAPLLTALPTSIDLRKQCPGVYVQGQLGSCTANASAGLAQFLMMKEGHASFVPSRLFIYYNERVIEGTVNQDSGASMSDAMQVLSQQGAPHESLWWYDINKFTVKPNVSIYNDGKLHTVSGAMNLDNTNLTELKTCLVGGYPFIFGVTVYESFESNAVAQTGIVPLPGNHEQVLGGHALMAVGYNDATQMFLVRNSWGAGWGIAGYCWMPYAYLTNPNLAQDFWTANVIK